jgi:hypothetical protein
MRRTLKTLALALAALAVAAAPGLLYYAGAPLWVVLPVSWAVVAFFS